MGGDTELGSAVVEVDYGWETHATRGVMERDFFDILRNVYLERPLSRTILLWPTISIKFPYLRVIASTLT